MDGKWTAQTLNRDSKTSGGIIGYTQKSTAVKKWILSQPARVEIARKCESMAGIHDEPRTRKDLDVSSSKKNEAAVVQVMDTVLQMINPFSGAHLELVNISSGVIAPPATSADLMNAYVKGENAVVQFMRDRLLSGEVPFFSPISKAKLATFSKARGKSATLHQQTPKVEIANERRLFTRLLLIGEKSNVTLHDLLAYPLANISFPLASGDGSIAKTDKAKLRNHILKLWPDCRVDSRPIQGATIVDGMAVIQAIKAGSLPNTFGKLEEMVLNIVVAKARHNQSSRLDVVFDTYPSISIKCLEHARRAGRAGDLQVRTIYGRDQALPKQWANYLLSGANKEALIEFIVESWTRNISPSKLGDMLLYVSHAGKCEKIEASNGVMTVSSVPELECDHEEADTKLLLHAAHAGQNEESVRIESFDTDVFVLALAHSKSIRARNFHLVTGSPKDIIVVDIRKLSNALESSVCDALIGLHNFTGSDTTSAFHGKG